jgi:hypothetical protein
VGVVVEVVAVGVGVEVVVVVVMVLSLHRTHIGADNLVFSMCATRQSRWVISQKFATAYSLGI